VAKGYAQVTGLDFE
jgi:hypothetical protein